MPSVAILALSGETIYFEIMIQPLKHPLRIYSKESALSPLRRLTNLRTFNAKKAAVQRLLIRRNAVILTKTDTSSRDRTGTPRGNMILSHARLPIPPYWQIYLKRIYWRRQPDLNR